MNYLKLGFMLVIYSSISLAESKVKDKFDLVWSFGKENIYPKRLSKRFEDKIYRKILSEIQNGKTIAEAMNPFLGKLNISHTHIYDENEYGYYFLRSLFSTKKIDEPKTVTIGAQLEKVSLGLKVRSILDGLASDKAGLKKGDIIIKINEKSAISISIFKEYANKEVELEVLSNGKQKKVLITPFVSSIHESFVIAMKNSIKVIRYKNKSYGYIHLWAGTDPKFLSILKETVFGKFKNTNGLILDLRDGYGGAWWSYLDPFFKNTKDYFIAKKVDREGRTAYLKPERNEHNEYYDKPMVVLINSGVRSGKEALAYQFKKSKRALLIGTKTEGAFTGGLGGFSNQEIGLIFYLATFELFLDDYKIEGIGIEPDIRLPYKYQSGKDNQFKRALIELNKLTREQ